MRGGYLHNDILTERLDAAWRSVGASTAREIAITDDEGRVCGYTDLLVRHGPTVIVVEVELSGRRVVRDLQKAVALHATELWIVVPNARVRGAVTRKLRRIPEKPEDPTICVLSLGQALQRVRNCFSLFSRANAGKKQV